MFNFISLDATEMVPVTASRIAEPTPIDVNWYITLTSGGGGRALPSVLLLLIGTEGESEQVVVQLEDFAAEEEHTQSLNVRHRHRFAYYQGIL